MRIIVANCRLAQRTGSELYTRELVEALRKRGHDMRVYSPVCGELAEAMRRDGVTVVEKLEELDFEPEVIHGQHHMTTMAILARFRGVNAVYQCHGSAPWEEWPPRHPRIVRYAGSSRLFQDWFEKQHSIGRELFLELPLAIDTASYRRGDGESGGRSRALVLSNYLKEGAEVETVRKACAGAGFDLDAIGWRFGNVSENLPEILPGYDLVFAAGRSALEAIASGCAVCPLQEGTMDDIVDEENFASFAERNFSPRPGSSSPVNANRAAELVRRVSEVDRRALANRVRKEHDLEIVTGKLEEVYESICGFSPGSGDEDPFFADYLERIAGRVLMADAEFRKLREGWQRTKEKYEALKARRDRKG